MEESGDMSKDEAKNKPELCVEVVDAGALESSATIRNVYGFGVDPRFTDLVPIGQGGSGMVFSAVDSDCEKNVAIKKICFTDQQSYKYALRELRIMRQLQHENVVAVYEILGPNGFSMDGKHTTTADHLFNSIYIVQEHMDVTLSQLTQTCRLSPDHIKFFLYQLLRGIKYIHSANVIHRDIKPTNILLNLDDLVLKIGDFGLSRVVDPAYCHRGYLTDRVGMCWYRAPELILTPRDYTSAIDMWGVGCVLGEMLLGQPLFTGAQEMEQMGYILDCVPLSDNEWNTVTQVLPSAVMRKHQRVPTNTLKSKLPHLDSSAIDMLELLLAFSPWCRVSAEEALGHAYLQQYACVGDEPVVCTPLHIEHEVDDLSIETLRQLLITEGRSAPTGCGSQNPSADICQTSQNVPESCDILSPLIIHPSSVESTDLTKTCHQGERTTEQSENVPNRVIAPASIGQEVVRDKNSQSWCKSLKESLYIDISDLENAKEFCQLSPKEKADRINSQCKHDQRVPDKNSPALNVKMKDRLNERRRGQSQYEEFSGSSTDPSTTQRNTGEKLDQSDLDNGGSTLFTLEGPNVDYQEKGKVKNILKFPDDLYPMHKEKSRSKESLFKKQMGKQKKNKQRAMNVRDFDSLYRLPTEHLCRHRRRTDDRLLSIKPLPEYNNNNNIENHVKLREELNERLRLAEIERDHFRGAVGGASTLEESDAPSGEKSVDIDIAWNSEKLLKESKQSSRTLQRGNIMGKVRRDSSSSSDDQRFEG